MDWKYFIVKILIFISLVLLISVKGFYYSNSEPGSITGDGSPVLPLELNENLEDLPNKRRFKKGGVDDIKKDNTTTNSTNSNDTLKNDEKNNKKRYSSYYRFKYQNSRFRDDNSYQQPSYDYVRPYSPPRHHYFDRDRIQDQEYNDNNGPYEQSFEVIRDYDEYSDRAEYEDLHTNLREDRPERTHLNYKTPLKKDPVTKKIIKPFINMNDFYTTTIKPEFPALLNPFHFHIPFFPKSKSKSKSTAKNNTSSSNISSSTVILNPRGIKRRLDLKDIPNTLEQLLEEKFGKPLPVDEDEGRLKRSKRSAEDDDDDDEKPKKKPVDKKKKETKKDGKKGKKDKEKEKDVEKDDEDDPPPAEEDEDQDGSLPVQVQERNPLIELGQILTGQQTQTQAPETEKPKKKDKDKGKKKNEKKSKGKSSTEIPPTTSLAANGSWPSTANGSLSTVPPNEIWTTTTWPTTMAPAGHSTGPSAKSSVDKTVDAITLKLPIDDQTYYLITMVKMSKSGAKEKMSRRKRSLIESQDGSLDYQEEDVKLILERMIDQLRTRCHPLDKKLMDKAAKNVHTLLKSVDNWSEFSTKFETSLETLMDKTPQCTRKSDSKISSISAESDEFSLEDNSDSNSNEVQSSGKFRKEIDSVIEIPLVDQNIELYALDEGGPLTRMKRIDEESSKKFTSSSSTTIPTPKKEIKRLTGPEIQILQDLPKPPSPSRPASRPSYGFNIRNNRNLDENDQFGGSSSIGQKLYEKLKEQYEPKKSKKSSSTQSIDELVFQKASKMSDLENQIIQDPPTTPTTTTTTTTTTMLKSKPQDTKGYDSSIIHIIVEDCDQIKPIIMDAAAQIILKQMEDDILYPSRGRFGLGQKNPQQIAQARMDNYLMNQIIGIFNHCSVNYQKALEMDEEKLNQPISQNNQKINDSKNKNIFLVKDNPKSKRTGGGMKVEFIQVQMELLENPAEPLMTFL